MDDPEDESGWQAEADAVIADIRDHVSSIAVSTQLPNTRQNIYLNLVTLEGTSVCVQLSGYGFQIVGHSLDSKNEEDGRVFETPYSLLDSVSPKFRESFGGQLLSKVMNLVNQKEDNTPRLLAVPNKDGARVTTQDGGGPPARAEQAQFNWETVGGCYMLMLREGPRGGVAANYSRFLVNEVLLATSESNSSQKPVEPARQ